MGSRCSPLARDRRVERCARSSRADSTAPIAAWVLQFADIFTFTVSPAVTDEELGAALGGVSGGEVRLAEQGPLIRVPMRFCLVFPGPPLPGMRW